MQLNDGIDNKYEPAMLKDTDIKQSKHEFATHFLYINLYVNLYCGSSASKSNRNWQVRIKKTILESKSRSKQVSIMREHIFSQQ